ncbi:MAG: right-handed parallel beta-helix repeat-containing protein, partial [Bacteroidota bacterium]|nr:right-handed parallel beta-helix repeat-containing protein [Bacteroidota bacterium]
MSQYIRKLLIIGVIIVSSQDLTAKNWYIDAERGLDSNTGNSPKKAWQTLTNANTIVLGPGDSLLLKSGTTYDGQLKPQGSGSVTAPVYIGCYGQSGHLSSPR